MCNVAETLSKCTRLHGVAGPRFPTQSEDEEQQVFRLLIKLRNQRIEVYVWVFVKLMWNILSIKCVCVCVCVCENQTGGFITVQQHIRQ